MKHNVLFLTWQIISGLALSLCWTGIVFNFRLRLRLGNLNALTVPMWCVHLFNKLSDCFSDLIIATTSAVVRYDLGPSSSVNTITYDDGTIQSLFVYEDGTSYLIVYNSLTAMFSTIRISVSGEIIVLELSFNEPVAVLVDRLHIYVYVINDNRIYVYSKRTLEKLWEIELTYEAGQLIIAYGK